MEKLKIVIIDDHRMIREGLQQLLELDGEISVIGQAGDGIEGLELLKKVNPDVILLDINMPNMNGIEMLEHLKKSNNEYKVLILTIHNEVEYLAKAIDIGVDGYILKDSECSTLKEAIFAVHDGKTYIQASLTPLLKERISYDETENSKIKSLSSREIDVLKLLSSGMLNRDIANVLDISEKTVKNHVANIFKKMNVSDRTQAAVMAIKYNIVDISEI